MCLQWDKWEERGVGAKIVCVFLGKQRENKWG